MTMTMTTMSTLRRRNRMGRLAAFTIMELIVTVAAMSIMMAAFGNILLQCKRVVSATHRTLRMNHRISVIADMFRRDIRRISKDGFLCVTEVEIGVPVIVFTTGGRSQSVLGDVQGFGSIVAWGYAPRADPDLPMGSTPPRDILWRPEFVFPTEGDDTSAADVATFLSGGPDRLQDYRSANRTDISLAVDSVVGQLAGLTGETFMLPPPSADEAYKLWKVICKDIEHLSISWTDFSEKTADNGFVWYGSDGGGSYRELWTSQEPGKWPKAVRLEFWFREGALPEGFGKVYEVVCDIP